MIRYKIDRSESVVVGVCREPGCGVRSLSSTTTAARQQRDDHEELCHMKRGRQATRRASDPMRRF